MKKGHDKKRRDPIKATEKRKKKKANRPRVVPRR